MGLDGAYRRPGVRQSVPLADAGHRLLAPQPALARQRRPDRTGPAVRHHAVLSPKAGAAPRRRHPPATSAPLDQLPAAAALPADTALRWQHIPDTGPQPDHIDEHHPVPGEYYPWRPRDDDFWPIRPAAGIRPVRIRPASGPDIPFAYSLAHALYQNPAPGLVPVSDAGPGRSAPLLRCDGVTVYWPDGKTIHYTVDNLPQGQHAAVSITAHCGTDTCPVDFPLPVLLHGRPYNETVIITESPNPDDSQAWQLGQHLWQAWYDQTEPPDDIDGDEYYDYLQVVVTRILHGHHAAFRQEFRNLAHRFQPRSQAPTESVSVRLPAGGGTVTWTPAG